MIDYELFERIIHAISTRNNQAEKFSKFLEENICKNSYCYVTFGEEMSDMLIEILCKEFNLKTNNEFYDNDISWWLYENVNKIIYYPDGTERDVNDLHDFYDYLVDESHAIAGE